MIQKIENGKVFLKCACGNEFVADHVQMDEVGGMKFDFTDTYNAMICESCGENAKAQWLKKQDEQRKCELKLTINERMMTAKIPGKFIDLEKPFVRHAAAWIYRNRESSLIISGVTGSGKTSSACFVARLMMLEAHINVRYYTRQTIFAEYVRAKKSDNDNEDRFLARLGRYDLMIIDELVGKKGDSKLSDSAQELFFNLIDGVYSQSRKTKIWIMGNFYKGATERLVNDAEPIKRRINESFKLAWIRENEVDEKVTLE